MALSRTLNFKAAKGVDHLHFLAAIGKTIEPAEKDWYVVNDTLRIHIESADPPLIRESQGRKELLVPVKLTDKAKIGLEYEW